MDREEEGGLGVFLATCPNKDCGAELFISIDGEVTCPGEILLDFDYFFECVVTETSLWKADHAERQEALQVSA
jgi:hypothetical protein